MCQWTPRQIETARLEAIVWAVRVSGGSGYHGLRPADGFRFSGDVDPAAAYQRRRGERMARGECQLCGCPSDGGLVCMFCRPRARAAVQAIRDGRRAQGLCTRCGGPLAPGSVSSCPRHLAADRARPPRVGR